MLSLLLLVRHRAWWPFERRARRPFTQASRLIRALADRDGERNAYRPSLLALHRAFDETAEQRLLAEDVARFLADHPALRDRSADIGRFFESSRRAFFADDLTGALATLPPGALAALAADLAQSEQQTA